MNIKLPLIVMAGVALNLVAINANADDGQRVLSHKQTCQITVPANWKSNPMIKSFVRAPDDSMSAVISSGAEDSTLAFAKSVVTSSYTPTRMFEDSPRRLFYEYEQSGGKFPLGIYVGVPGNHHDVCGAQISFKSASQLDAAKQIALSVKPAS